jgi:beta-glucosidase/6-phospho-beta-glucosidase/beta-galactosidase
VKVEFIGAFESIYMPAHDLDVLETSGHSGRWKEDLALLRASGITTVRYPIRWHRIERRQGLYDWQETDEVLGFLKRQGFRPIVDLIHHTSYPRWLKGGFFEPSFGDWYLGYCEAFARRYPWVPGYTLFNEPFTTMFLCGHEGIWPPYGRGIDDFVRICRNVLPAFFRASRMFKELLPGARHFCMEVCEGHSGRGPRGARTADLANDRRFFILDLLTGRTIESGRPFVAELLAAGGEDLLELPAGNIDVLGLDYYAHNEWQFTDEGGIRPSPTPFGLAELAHQYHERYQLPMVLGETNIRGFCSDRATWLKHTVEQCEIATRNGTPIEGFCWFPFIDSLDWDSLLARCDRHIDPVGVYWLDEQLNRRSSTMSDAYRLAAQGASSSELPAYRLSPQVLTGLKGFMPFMADWQWQTPPPEEVVEERLHAIAS